MLGTSTELSISYDSVIIFSSSDTGNLPSKKLVNSTDSSRKKYQLTQENGKSFIYVMSSIFINESIVSIITKRDISETTTMINNNIWRLRIFIVAILLVAGLIVYFISLLLTKPLEDLNTVTDSFAKGDFSIRSSIRSKDEIGLLSDKFNHMADSVEDHIDELNDMLHRRDQFVADFTHEIKTPMTTIIGYSDTIRSVDLPREDTVRAADYIFSEGKRLEQMSSHLFDLIYLKDGEIPMLPVNTQALGEAVVTTILPSLKEKNITLDYSFENGEIIGDSVLLKSVFVNLIDNARKASEKGSTIHFKGHSSSGYEFIVEDHGIGIEKKDLDRICDEFYMVDKSRSRSEGGAGLGMSLVATILNKHGAKLDIESSPGEGTKMKVIFENNEEG